jgi:hypothetical protein
MEEQERSMIMNMNMPIPVALRFLGNLQKEVNKVREKAFAEDERRRFNLATYNTAQCPLVELTISGERVPGHIVRPERKVTATIMLENGDIVNVHKAKAKLVHIRG